MFSLTTHQDAVGMRYPRRRNSDADERSLERRLAQGDLTAIQGLVLGLLRSGAPMPPEIVLWRGTLVSNGKGFAPTGHEHQAVVVLQPRPNKDGWLDPRAELLVPAVGRHGPGMATIMTSWVYEDELPAWVAPLLNAGRLIPKASAPKKFRKPRVNPPRSRTQRDQERGHVFTLQAAKRREKRVWLCPCGARIFTTPDGGQTTYVSGECIRLCPIAIAEADRWGAHPRGPGPLRVNPPWGQCDVCHRMAPVSSLVEWLAPAGEWPSSYMHHECARTERARQLRAAATLSPRDSRRMRNPGKRRNPRDEERRGLERLASTGDREAKRRLRLAKLREQADQRPRRARVLETGLEGISPQQAEALRRLLAVAEKGAQKGMYARHGNVKDVQRVLETAAKILHADRKTPQSRLSWYVVANQGLGKEGPGVIAFHDGGDRYGFGSTAALFIDRGGPGGTTLLYDVDRGRFVVVRFDKWLQRFHEQSRFYRHSWDPDRDRFQRNPNTKRWVEIRDADGALRYSGEINGFWAALGHGDQQRAMRALEDAGFALENVREVRARRVPDDILGEFTRVWVR